LRSAAASGRDFEASDLGHLPLLSAVIKETLRLCAPAPMGAMKYVENQEGADMCGHHVPKVGCALCPLSVIVVLCRGGTECPGGPTREGCRQPDSTLL